MLFLLWNGKLRLHCDENDIFPVRLGQLCYLQKMVSNIVIVCQYTVLLNFAWKLVLQLRVFRQNGANRLFHNCDRTFRSKLIDQIVLYYEHSPCPAKSIRSYCACYSSLNRQSYINSQISVYSISWSFLYSSRFNFNTYKKTYKISLPYAGANSMENATLVKAHWPLSIKHQYLLPFDSDVYFPLILQ